MTAKMKEVHDLCSVGTIKIFTWILYREKPNKVFFCNTNKKSVMALSILNAKEMLLLELVFYSGRFLWEHRIPFYLYCFACLRK
jgi:hypothetical protein